MADTVFTKSDDSTATVSTGTTLDSSDYPSGWSASDIKEVVIGTAVETIGDNAFKNCYYLTTVTIGDSVTSIGTSAFYNCNALTTLTIPDGVTSIGGQAFQECSALTTLTIPDSVTSIGDYAFRNCDDLQLLTIGTSVETIGIEAFYSCSSLQSLIIPDSVTSIGTSAFAFCQSLTTLTIPDSVTSIGAFAFAGCVLLTTVTLPTNVNFTSIGDGAFQNCSKLTTLTIPDSVTSIGIGAFYGCSELTTMTIPNSVKTIGLGAFYTCPKLTTVTLPINDNFKVIKDRTFQDCSSLTTMYIPDSVTEISATVGEGAFEGSILSTLTMTPNNGLGLSTGVQTIGRKAGVSVFVGDAPTFTSTAVTTATADIMYRYTVTTSDVDAGDTVTVTATTIPSWLSFNGNILSGTPTNSDVGTYNVVLLATDSNLSTATQSFTIVVVGVPTFTSTGVTSATEEVAYSSTVTTSHPNEYSVTVTATTKPSWLSFDGTTLSGTPSNSDVGNHGVVLIATDSNSATATQSFTITVTNVNVNPTFTSTAVTTATEDVAYSYTVTTSHPNGDSVTVTAIIPTASQSWLSFSNNILSGTPSNSDVGSHNVLLTATDSNSATAIQFLTITVEDVNNAPTFTSTAVKSATEGQLYNYTVTTSPVNAGDTVSVTATKICWLSFNGTTNVLSGTPSNIDVGSHRLLLTATDSNSATATQEFTIVVNEPPTFTSRPPTTARQESLYSYNVTTSDPDLGDTVTVKATRIPSWLSFNTTTNVLSGTPSRSVWGEYNIILTATDGYVSVIQSFTIMVRKPVCFNEGTKILIFKEGKEQYVAIEQLREGDEVKTLNHGYKKINDMRKGSFKLNGLMDMGMYRMKKQGNMTADLEMSGLHCVLVDKDDTKYADDIKRQEGLNNKKLFIDGKFRLRARESHEFEQMEQKEYTIYSFALEDKQEQYGVWANGVLVETTKRKNLEISNMERVTALVKGTKQ